MDRTLKLELQSLHFSNLIQSENDGVKKYKRCFGSVLPEGNDVLEFTSGEVFQNSQTRFQEAEKTIVGSLNIGEAANGITLDKSRINFFVPVVSDEYQSDALLAFSIFLSKDEFDELWQSIKVGLYPKIIQVSFRDKEFIEFGWEPDGSRQVWDNAGDEQKSTEITGIEFLYDVMETSEEYDEGHEVIGSTYLPTLGRGQKISKDVSARLVSIENEIRYYRPFLYIVIVLLIGIAAAL